MKVMFLFQALPHYYNFVLSKLNDVPGLEIVNVVSIRSRVIGEGVHQSIDGVNFKIIKLPEHKAGNDYYRLKGLSQVILSERPDIIVAVKPFARGFVYHLPLVVLRKFFKIKIIMKDIPFRMKCSKERREELRQLRQRRGEILKGVRWITRANPAILFRERSYDAKVQLPIEDLQALYEKAAQSKGKGQYQEALDVFETIMSSCGKEARQFYVSALYHMGDIYERIEDKGKSREYFKQCLALQPDHYRAGMKIFPILYSFLYGTARIIQRLLDSYTIMEQRYVYNAMDAYVNYVEDAIALYGSFGVPRSKIFVTYNSPDTDRLLEIKDELLIGGPVERKPYRLIHVGRLVAWKRVDMLIRSFRSIKDHFPDADLVVIGFGPEEKRLKALAQQLGLAGSITFCGGIYDPHVLGKYLLSSALYVLAGMGGISINEAMSFGLPVICSVCDGTEKYLVRDGYNGSLFRDGDVADLTEKVIRLLSDQALMRTMGKNSEYVIRNGINIHTVVRGYLDAFNSVNDKEHVSYAGSAERKPSVRVSDKVMVEQ